ncbi:hypothetical protein TRICI_003100 [Trichomonascus ciferrii]|uniref:UBX domain-containing protein n=1 Tax=Trichomonascus ciferrii TaxID=44093 RepID=A0A642V432_9ASCO|nr:hypothetical protein TRICI_003100 [Trichomonascus ciferrii]
MRDGGLLALSREARVLDLIKEKTVPLQVTEGSKDYGFFSQVFPVKAVPSIYVIKQSQILDVFTEDLSLEAFIERFERSLGLGGEEQQTLEETEQLNSATATNTATGDSSSASRRTGSQPEEEPGNEQPSASSQPFAFSAASSSINQRAPADKTSSKSTPSSSSSSSSSAKNSAGSTSSPGRQAKGKAVEHKKSESEKYQERVRRERQAEAEERRRILRLVETDRQERKRAAQQHKSGGDAPATTTATNQSNKPRAFSNSTQCALSLRLFDGRALKHHFSSSDTLQQVREWVDTNRTDGDQPYTFFQTIPKKTFGAGEEQYTLRQLELTPSSTLILKPISNYSTAYSSSAATYSPAAMLQRGTRAVGDALYTFLGLGYDPHSPYSSEESSRSSSPVPTSDSPSSTPNVRTINNPNDDRTTYNGNQLSLKDDHRKDA